MTVRIFAYGSTPKDGGTFTFYQNLRPALLEHGWDMRCISTGMLENGGWNNDFADEGCVQIAPDENDVRKQSIAVMEWCAANGVSVIMPVNSRPILNAIPHIPSNIRIVSRCADSIDIGYRKTVYGKERASRIVATTPRHIEDLQQQYSVRHEQLALIPHGIDLAPFSVNRSPSSPSVLRIAFVGRLFHDQKGVLYIPGIVQTLEKNYISYSLRVIGSGVHQALMEQKMLEPIAAGRVKFLGTVVRSKLPSLLSEADIFLFPSQHEGFGFALIEGMAAGCVPVASLLAGVSDFIVENGRTGFLKPVGDVEGFAEAIMTLHNDRQRLHAMSHAAAQAVRERFSVERMAADYARLLNAVMDEPLTRVPPLPWSSFRPPQLDPRRWHSFIPRPVKRLIRQSLYRVRT